MPDATPVIVAVVPAPETVAIATLLLDHEPPAGVQVTVAVPGAQTAVVPEIAEGSGLTVTVTVVGADDAPPPVGVTTQLYTPALATVAAGMDIEAPVAKKPDGPDHVYTGPVTVDEAVSVIVWPTQYTAEPLMAGGGVTFE
jgi:hypothetical protein